MTTELYINELTAALEQAIMGPEGETILVGLGALAIVAAVTCVIFAVMALIHLVCRWKIFTKAGEKGWKSLIPFYNTYTEFSFTWTGVQGLLMMGALMIGNILSNVCAPDTILYAIGGLFALYATAVGLVQTHKLSQSFGHKFGFTLGLIFLNPIFMLILAFGKKSQYVGTVIKNK